MAQLITKSDYNVGTKTMPTAQGGEVLAVRDSAAWLTTKSLNDILALMPLPADHVPVDAILDSDDTDTGTSEQISLGILNAGMTDLSTATADGGGIWIDGSTVPQAGGIARPTTKFISRVKPAATTRYVGVKLKVPGSATAGTVGVTLLYRAANVGEKYDT